MTNDAFLIAHPAHELSVTGWLNRNPAQVHILTDGSGRQGKPRIEHSRQLLTRMGCQTGAVFGKVADRKLYSLVIQQDFDFFNQLANHLADSLVQHDIHRVFGDAEQKLVMAHDLFRGVRLAAVHRAEQILGRSIQQFDFGVDSPIEPQFNSMRVKLLAAQLRAKLTRAFEYAPVRSFVDLAIAEHGMDFLGTEVFTPVDAVSPMNLDVSEPSEWERHGQALVESGHCESWISLEEHLIPIFRSLGVLFNQNTPPQHASKVAA